LPLVAAVHRCRRKTVVPGGGPSSPEANRRRQRQTIAGRGRPPYAETVCRSGRKTVAAGGGSSQGYGGPS
jgi:hypothetical protein